MGVDEIVLRNAKEKAGEFEEKLNFQRLNRVNEQFNASVAELVRQLENN